MQRPWLKSYPPEVPATITVADDANVPALIDAACREFPRHRALGNFGSFIDYRRLARDSQAFATYLQCVCGVRRGTRVALMMPNMLAYGVAMLGVLRAGAVVVNINPLYTAREFEAQFTDSGAEVIVVFEQALATVIASGLRPNHVIVSRLGDGMPVLKAWLVDTLAARRATSPIASWPGSLRFRDAVAIGARMTFEPLALRASDLAFLQYTGGTTGAAKGAMLSHGNVVANMLQVIAWFGSRAERGRETVITALPLYHIYALTANCLATLAQGGLVYLITNPRDLDTFVRELKRQPFTTLTGVNTLFNALLDHPGFASVDFSSLKLTNGGGAAVQRAVAERWAACTGCVLTEGYGLTEASPVVAVNRLDSREFSGGIGLPVPSTEVRIVGEQGHDLALGEAGELWVRGPQVMQGYWMKPAETRAVLDEDGWLRTGDIAVMAEDGSLRLVDRKKDLIIVSGFNVYPNEIEEVAAAHPGVREVAVIGIADPRSGEAVRLVVVRSDPALDEVALTEWCRAQLAAYKAPRSVLFVEELPKSNVGKILRREVRARYGAA